jgi:hypothetical protein
VSLRAADLPKRIELSGTVNAAGTLTLRFSPNRTPWSVEQITIEMATAPAGSACFLRVNDALVTPLISAGDAAAGEPPLPLFPGDVGEIEWTGATPGAQGKALVIYRGATY